MATLSTQGCILAQLRQTPAQNRLFHSKLKYNECQSEDLEHQLKNACPIQKHQLPNIAPARSIKLCDY